VQSHSEDCGTPSVTDYEFNQLEELVEGVRKNIKDLEGHFDAQTEGLKVLVSQQMALV
jgi:hypothetical protein